MAVATSYPGVYIEEVPSGVRTIAGVATSITAFIGFFRRGPMNEPVQVLSPADFERVFGGLDRRSEASYAIRQFFLNGGSEAWVVRTASGDVQRARVSIQSAIEGPSALIVEAKNPGGWGIGLRIGVHPVAGGTDRFDLTVSLVEIQAGQSLLTAEEVFNNLSMNPSDPRFVETIINDDLSGSKLIEIFNPGDARPLETGTLSGDLSVFPTITSESAQVDVTIGTDGPHTAVLLPAPGTSGAPGTLGDVRRSLESAIRAANPASRAFSEASVSVENHRLRILAGGTVPSDRVTFAAGGRDPLASRLGLTSGASLGGVLSGDLSGAFGEAISGDITVTIGDTSLDLTLPDMGDLAEARNALESAIRDQAAQGGLAEGNVGFQGVRVAAYRDGADDRLIVLSGVANEPVSFADVAPGTVATDLRLLSGAGSEATTALVSSGITPVPTVSAGSAVNLTIGAVGPRTATIDGEEATTLEAIAARLQEAVRNAADDEGAPFEGVRVAAYGEGENILVVLPATADEPVVFAAAPADRTTVEELQLDNAAANVQAYTLGSGGAVDNTAQGEGAVGNDGAPPDGAALIGDLNARTGIFALEGVDLFNILCLPGTAELPADEAAAVVTQATNYCERRRAFFILDPPQEVDEVQEVRDWLDANVTRHRNAAFYFPRVQIPDPLDDFRLRSIGASGTIAGLYARTDAERGVWKAPAGTEAVLRGVRQLDRKLTDAENGTLNPLGINCLRTFPVYGRVCWGAHTLVGSDQQADQWKYVPVRRLALYLQESLYRGTQWVVFEPNDEPLWAQIRLNVGAFMQNLFRQGAFQGTTPQHAYFVKCDGETTTQNDIDRGIVNILVGFAPLKPAEFVIVRIQQIAGQIET